MNLPKIFKNKIDENIKNSQYTYYGLSNRNINNIDLNQLPIDAIIETKDRIFKARIIAKTNNYLITDKKEVIYIPDCLNIKNH
ncbi:MAG: hypothetical protein PHH51_01270 [Bacilli bacterium]|nr:hypothetical protein [Bacilli bacterium]MDD3895415.1 hypothetical protein [Bacilli bacterium]MDD4407626.1 hypothetical protein [Bacilli bacterium]